MYKTLHKKQGSVTVQLRFARSSVTFCAKRDNKKISSVKSFLDNMEYTKNSNDQKALDEKKKAIQEEIE